MSLGPPIRPDPAPKKPPAEDWRPYKPGFEINGEEKLRTTNPPPAPKPTVWGYYALDGLDAAMWWLSSHSGEA